MLIILIKKSKTIVLGLVLLMFSSGVVMVFADTGGIRIDPTLPIGLDSPADFEIWGHTGDAYDPHVLLVMTASCKDGLSGEVVFSWAGGSTGAITEWNLEAGVGKVPEDTTNGAGYTVSSLKSHLETDEDIYWAFVSILDGETMVQNQHYKVTAEMTSSSPSMLVYIMGKGSDDAELFDMRIPPTIPGFVVPEAPLGAIGMITLLLGAAAAFAYKRGLGTATI